MSPFAGSEAPPPDHLLRAERERRQRELRLKEIDAGLVEYQKVAPLPGKGEHEGGGR
jgi:hypothetical protein